MAISDLKGIIDATIKTNGRQEITGASLNEVLTQMVDATDAELAKLSQGKEDKTNKVTSLTEESTDVQYPSAKAVYALSERISENEILIEDLQNTKIDKEADDYYPQLAVGLADNLAGVDVVDSEINFRRSGGGAISDGVARIEAIKGNSVVWNQGAPTERAAGTADNTSGSSIMYESTNVVIKQYTKNINGHIIYTKVEDACEDVPYYYFTDNIQKNLLGGVIFTANTAANTRSIVYAQIPPGINASWDIKVTFVDLTLMFGAGNEPTTIEEFYARIPMGVDLNAYNEGEVIHMDVQSIESQGVNAWDEEWEVGTYNLTTGEKSAANGYIRSANLCKCLPNEKYYIKTTKALYILWYDNNQNYISNIWASNGIIQAPSNAAYLAFRSVNSGELTTYNHDICINIFDASINGKYFPYIKRVEDLSIIRKYFPNGMKSAGSAHDEIRYNKATQKWEYSKGKIKTLRLADLVWYYAPTPGYFYSNDIDNLKSIEETKFNILCNVIVSCGWYPFTVNYGGNKATRIAPYTMLNTTRSRVNILNTAYTDVSAFIAWLEEANATLYYESNDWEWEELDAEDQFKDLDYQVWNCGTEKAISEGISAPLAADITYGFNAIGKIKELESLVAALRAKVGI